ncbi:hypothetical protein CDAR_594711 [Caerostris darwini]|uniref:Uncharacterized protein n=1 Tax=Caerostris darwini TaxID=1538125 RepID=A0AAV4WV50_9ARAC|nr:hypothetical protein CDAR_594711 [Caerostris darwini]
MTRGSTHFDAHLRTDFDAVDVCVRSTLDKFLHRSQLFHVCTKCMPASLPFVRPCMCFVCFTFPSCAPLTEHPLSAYEDFSGHAILLNPTPLAPNCKHLTKCLIAVFPDSQTFFAMCDPTQSTQVDLSETQLKQKGFFIGASPDLLRVLDPSTTWTDSFHFGFEPEAIYRPNGFFCSRALLLELS